MANITLQNIDKVSRQNISALIHETVMASPGTYEIPALCRIVESKSIWNAHAIHLVLDDQLDFGEIELDKFNRLVPRTPASTNA